MRILLALPIVLCLAGAPLQAAVESNPSKAIEPTTRSYSNVLCPICSIQVSGLRKPTAFAPRPGAKVEHPEMIGAPVVCCSMECKTEFEKEPELYERSLYPQWLRWKNAQVK